MTDENEQSGDRVDTVTLIKASLEEHGLAPEGEYDIAGATIKALSDLKSTMDQIGVIGTKLMEAGLVTEVGDGLAALDFVIVRHKELEAERDTLKNLVDEYDAKAAAAALAAQKKAKAVPVKRSEKARAIGPIKLKKEGKAPDAEEIIELISAAEEVVIAFSDGKNEITALPPQVIHGDAWYQQGNAVKLRLDSLKVYGPNRDEKPITLDGYGLILDGELVAYSSRIDKLVLAPGSINELKDDIVFYG